MTSPAPTSWFSGLSRSSSTMAGGVASAPTPASASASGPASVFLPDAPKSVIGAGSGGGKRNHLCGALFKYGPKSAQVRASPTPRVAPLSLGKFWNPRWRDGTSHSISRLRSSSTLGAARRWNPWLGCSVSFQKVVAACCHGLWKEGIFCDIPDARSHFLVSEFCFCTKWGSYVFSRMPKACLVHV